EGPEPCLGLAQHLAELLGIGPGRSIGEVVAALEQLAQRADPGRAEPLLDALAGEPGRGLVEAIGDVADHGVGDPRRELGGALPAEVLRRLIELASGAPERRPLAR